MMTVVPLLQVAQVVPALKAVEVWLGAILIRLQMIEVNIRHAVRY